MFLQHVLRQHLPSAAILIFLLDNSEPYKSNQTVFFSFFFKLASAGVIYMDKYIVLLYCRTIPSNMSMYVRVLFAEKYLNILFFIVVFHLSTTLDFCSFSVE